MLNRKFTLREKLLLLVLAVLFLGLFYYIMLMEPVASEIRRCSVEQVPVEEELNVQMLMAAQKKKMLDEMAETPKKSQGEICPYNNLKNEMNDLDGALAAAVSYNISFSEARAAGTIVRRNISIAFQTDSYDKARFILQQIRNSRYRCIIKDVNLSAGKERGKDNGMSGADQISGSVEITFYETTVGAKDTTGLVYEKSDKEK